jgi:S-formylglutathione hydrolase
MYFTFTKAYTMKHNLASVWALIVLAALLVNGCGAPAATPQAVQAGKVDLAVIPAPALAHNVLNDPQKQQIAVYLPPGYQGSGLSYPVVYYLAGAGASLGSPHGYAVVQTAADRALAAGKMRPMIVVTVSGFNALGASMYANSPVSGNWEDFVVQDVVGYVDSHYRTQASPASRGIAGHSMGGYGAFDLAMHHPDVFGAVYSLSPALFDLQGLASSMMFSSPETVNTVLDTLEALEQAPPAQAGNEFRKRFAQAGPAAQMSFAYGSAFAPAPDKKPPFILYPYHRSGGQVLRDEAVWAQWEGGWGALADKVQRYQANLRQLTGIGFEYGQQDENAWIPPGCEYLAQQLSGAGITYSLASFKGTHYDQLGQRIEGFLLPFLSKTLVFEGK